MIRRPPRSTLDRSSAASDGYKRQPQHLLAHHAVADHLVAAGVGGDVSADGGGAACAPVSYTHLRAHETVLDLVCRLLLEKTHCTGHVSYTHVQVYDSVLAIE